MAGLDDLTAESQERWAKAEQKYVKRVVNGKEPVPEDPVRPTVTRSFAVQTRKNLPINLLVIPVSSYCLGNVVGDLSIFWIVLSVVFVLITILLVREFRQADDSSPQRRSSALLHSR